MSRKERDRLKAIEPLGAGQLTQVAAADAAAKALGESDRKETVPPLVKALEDKRAIEPLKGLLDDSESEARLTANEALYEAFGIGADVYEPSGCADEPPPGG